MMTQTHLLVSAAVFNQPNARARNLSALLGALAPDAVIYGFFVWSKFARVPEGRLWTELYFQEPMTTLQSISNSVPLLLSILLLSIVLARPKPAAAGLPKFQTGARWIMPLTMIFAASALIHLACDLPVHHDDAHAHFWPFTDWRFNSPVSYWDPAHHGRYFGLFESGLGVALALALFRRFRAWWVRDVLILAIIAYAAVPVYFVVSLG